ncbi:hypothetical protein GO495_31735, partial [Chitinophaga oryziterrae]
ELCYDYGFGNKELNGNIAGAKWKSRSDGIARAFGYDYDNANRITQAAFNQQNSGSTTWAQNLVNFSVSGLTYDVNGNILSLKQLGMNGPVPQTIDSLKYGYNATSNKLGFVTDKRNDPTSKLGDFKEINNNETQDYWYDFSGNVSMDKNKNIDSIFYNHLNLASIIYVHGKGQIYYQYKGTGEKVTKIVVDTSVTPVKVTTTHYVNDLVYEQDTLQYISHEEGRIRPVYKTSQPVSYAYDYFVKDHLGNVRMVLGTQTDTALYVATMETAASAVENALFSNIDNTRTAKPTGYPTDNTTNPNAYVAKLNASNGQKIGPSLVLRVMAGDSITIAVKALYKNAGASTPYTTSSSMVTSILQAFSGGGISDGVHSGTGGTAPVNMLTSGVYDGLKSKDSLQNLSGKPKAYLNFALFDDQFNLVDENSGVRQVQGPIDSLVPLVLNKTPIKKTGFLYIYTSNESAQDVFFDNLIITHNAGPLLEETHYYPYGGSMAGISSKALKGANYVENKRKYNGIELNDDFDLNEYDAYYRILDQTGGRWYQLDPKIDGMEMWSPYASNYDNPIRYSDFLGDIPNDPPTKFPMTTMAWEATEDAAFNIMVAGGGPADPVTDVLAGGTEIVGTALVTLALAYDAYQNVKGSGVQEAAALPGTPTAPAKMPFPIAGSLIGDTYKGPIRNINGAQNPAGSQTKQTTQQQASTGLPKPDKGKGSTPPNQRDPKRVYTKEEKQQMLDKQDGNCAQCGQSKKVDEVHGHHVVRHADGGKTNLDNGAAVCPNCHVKLHN